MLFRPQSYVFSAEYATVAPTPAAITALPQDWNHHSRSGV